MSLEFAHLPRGVLGHNADCLCRLHEQGTWAGFDPLSGSCHMPNSRPGKAVRERLERRYRVRFLAELGPVEWQRQRTRHVLAVHKDEESRWHEGRVSALERAGARWRTGAAAGRWPDPLGQFGPPAGRS